MLSVLVISVFLTTGAQSLTAFYVPASSPVVIQWLGQHRDSLVQAGGAQVVQRSGSTLWLRRDGIDVRLSESAQVGEDTAAYQVRLLGASRKLRSWSTDVRITSLNGGTWISISVSASVYGLGEQRVQYEIDAAVGRVRRRMGEVFR